MAKKLLPTILRSNVPFAQKLEAFFHLTNNFAYPLLLLLSILLLPNLPLRTQHGWREVLLIDLPLFFGTTLSIASFYITSQREIASCATPASGARSGGVKRLPLVMSLGIGLCVNQTRAVLEALFGRETEFVRTPKHGIRGKLEGWTGKKYRAAKSLTPFIEVLLAAYFAVAIGVAIDHRPLPLDAVPAAVPLRLRLRRLGFGVAGGASGAALRGLVDRHGRRGVTVVAPPAYPVVAGRATDSLSGEIVIDDGAWSSRELRRTPEPPSVSAYSAFLIRSSIFGAGNGADDLTDDLPLLEHEQGGDAADVVLGGDLGVRVDVALPDAKLSVVVLGQRLDVRRDRAARARTSTAQKSTSTGSFEPRISVWKLESVTSTMFSLAMGPWLSTPA